MKVLSFLIMLVPASVFGQWNDDGNSHTSGNLTVGGSIQSNTTYGFMLQPTSGDAVIKRNNAGSLMISSGGGSSEIRFNYNYGGGSGGISIFDGGTINHSTLKVDGSGRLGISSSGGVIDMENHLNLGINQLEFLSASGGSNRIHSEGGAGIYGNWLFKSRFDHIILDAGESTGNERQIIFKSGGVHRMQIDEAGNIAIG